MSTKNILITGSRAPATLFLIRKLSKAGYNIFVAESCDYFLGKYSIYVKQNYKITAPNTNFEQFMAEIIKIVQKEKIDLIIPTCEEIFHISKGKDILKVIFMYGLEWEKLKWKEEEFIMEKMQKI